MDKAGSNHHKIWTCEVALPWSGEDFFALATGTPHPMEGEPVLLDRTKRAITDILMKGRKNALTRDPSLEGLTGQSL